MGIPLRTGAAIDSAVHDILVRAGVAFDIDETNVPGSDAVYDQAFSASVDGCKESWCGLLKYTRSIQLDTGANGTFMYTDIVLESRLGTLPQKIAPFGLLVVGATPGASAGYCEI